jgi:hypothetical protein
LPKWKWTGEVELACQKGWEGIYRSSDCATFWSGIGDNPPDPSRPLRNRHHLQSVWKFWNATKSQFLLWIMLPSRTQL